MNNKLIYIADDEINICNIIKSFLVKQGFKVEIFTDGQSLLESFNRKQADMLIIDIIMPKMDGYALCSSIRLMSSVPIIIVSAKDTDIDKITGFNLGCDDYLTKPFSPLELIERINSIFRRINLNKRDLYINQVVEIFDVSINLNTKLANSKGINLNLTLMELSLLQYLIENKNRVISRDELLTKVWGFECNINTRTTDTMIKRIRKKLSYADSILKIHTVRGFGFAIYDN